MRDVHFGFCSRTILDGVDVDIVRGKVTAIMGPSGCGKTTVLRLIGGQHSPQAGTVEVDGIDVHHLGRKQLFELRKRMGMMFQNGALLTDLTSAENVAYTLREHSGLPERMIRDIVLMKLQAVGLRGAADIYPEHLLIGHAPEALANFADRAGADLLVMGSRQRKSLDRAILGSTTEETLTRARCDVLVIPCGSTVQ
ncbi:MAG: ATP-binding cassette domain-containing protein [Pseudomonadota bacterium]|nr:ATP-binding cassette domain-containing protein [Pseudomonadota bacterium]